MAALACGVVSSAGAQNAPAPAAAAAAAPAAANANINISPKRVTFDRNTRSATVFVFNQGTTPATVDIALVDRIMLPNGQILPVADAQTDPKLKGEIDQLKSAKAMTLVTPRRTILEPGKGQTIRLRINPDAAASGEFRTHLTVTTVPPRDVGLTAEQAASNSPNQLRFIITSTFGISIPVIIRTGTPDVRASIANAKLAYEDISPDNVAPPKRTPVVEFDLVRGGANSLFGNIEVRSSKSRGGDPLGIIRGVGVYPEIDKRSLTVPLTRAPAPGEALEVTFTDDDTSPGNVLARSAVGS
jgi:P pilus assembly chaperone PapD